jgi:hypothetical protein
MTETPGRGSWNSGCLIGALIGAGAVAAVLALVVVGALLFMRQKPSFKDMVLPNPSAEAPAQVGEGGAEEDTAPGAEDDDACVSTLPVLVKLLGANAQGQVRYLVDDQDEVLGDAALIAFLKKLAAGDPKQGEEPVAIMVDLDVATASGITQAQVDAAVKACWAAGAAVKPPPDLSKEKKQ